jgi:nucleotide-binding universal stress UspA family protein
MQVNRIVVGIDGSKGSQLALEWAVAEARQRGAVLCVVHAWHPPYVSAYPLGPAQTNPQIYENLARQVLDDSLASVDTDGLAGPIEKAVVTGGAAAGLLQAAKDADLVVVGARGLGGFMGLVLGSVSSQVVHHAPCPVVVVPERD